MRDIPNSAKSKVKCVQSVTRSSENCVFLYQLNDNEVTTHIHNSFH